MKNLVRKNIFDVKQYIPGKPIEEVERELGLKDVVKMASNENCLGVSPKAIEAIRKNLKDVNRYPDSSMFYLKKKLSRILGVKEENLIFGNGSDEIIVLAVKTFLNDNDEAVIAKPTFLIYEIATQVQNAKIRFVPLTSDFRYDLAAMSRAVTPRTKIVFIANPDNPTGSYISKKELDDFFKALPRNVIIFLDEAYFEFADYTFADYPNGIDYLSKHNVIVARSFSKAYGLAGLRIGYGISDPQIINYMERVREPFNVNLLAQAAALAALDDKAFLEKTLRYVDGEKKFLYGAFRKMGLKYVESATNFILVDVKKDCRQVFDMLLKKGVIVRDMKGWGMETFIRVTVGTRTENKKFIKALTEVL